MNGRARGRRVLSPERSFSRLGFTRALAVEEAPHGIRVNAVCPGGTITPFHIRRAAAREVSEEELRRTRSEDNGLFGRWAEPREVAYPIL